MKKFLFLAAAALSSMFTANAALSETDFASNDYVKEWGRLKLVGNQLSSESGQPIQLKGWSLFSINYPDGTACQDLDGFKAMKSWGANIVRIAIYVRNSNGGYNESQDGTIKKLIGYCKDLGMYALVDWHVLETDKGPCSPVPDQSTAKGMFDRISSWAAQNGMINVLYEICNEPSCADWSTLKNYANYVLPTIENNDPGAVVIVGTPSWDQEIGSAAGDPIKGYSKLNLMYAFHLYSCSHMGFLGRLQDAVAKIPVFISEWGAVAYDGGGAFCPNEAQTFLSNLNTNNQLVSWCYWAWGKKNETSNTLTNCGSGNYKESNLSTSGKWIVNIMNGGTKIEEIATGEVYGGEATKIPFTGENYAILNIGNYDLGGQNVAYYDANSSAYGKTADGAKDESTYNTSGDEYIAWDQVGKPKDEKTGAAVGFNAGIKYADLTDPINDGFRPFEDVDVSTTCVGLAGWYGLGDDGYGCVGGDLHNLCMTEPGEWVNYTVNVQKAGYYSLAWLTCPATNSNGNVSMSICNSKDKVMNGNIVRDWSEHDDKDAEPTTYFNLNKPGKCGYDETTGKQYDTDSRASTADWLCWGWTKVGAGDYDKKNIRVLFKKTGEYTIRLGFALDDIENGDPAGDISNIKFTLESEDIPEFELAANTENVEADNVAVYPNPSNGDVTIAVDGQASVTITNAMGAVVYMNNNVEGSVNVNGLNHGIYNIKVTSAKNVVTKKLIVK
ncbi:MAG: cellulase family glycosylhydrolase [Paludibacteraceae bacterium]|nr:cellulase family glycosylhydrolase [Paludibacteraceae bacterium]